jgi:hypothetical protein
VTETRHREVIGEISFRSSDNVFTQKRQWRITDGEYSIVISDDQYQAMGLPTLRVLFALHKAKSFDAMAKKIEVFGQ